MKSVLTKALLLVLCLAMIIPFTACGETTETPDGKGTSANTSAGEAEAETENKPFVEKNNYDEEFVAAYCSDIFQKGYFFVDPDNRDEGNDLDDKLYEREIQVEEYLGVEITALDEGTYTDYTTKFKNSVASGDDDYQMLMTHTYMDVANLITGNFLYDMVDMEEHLNLEADYWNYDLMDDLSINGAMYLGYNDFCLSQVYVVAFNKTMYEPYQPTMGSLYELVDNGEWTLDKMAQVAALIDEDGDADTKKYGLALHAWVPLISFMAASEIKIVEKDADGELFVTTNQGKNEKFIALHEKLYDLCNANYTYCWAPVGNRFSTTTMSLAEGRTLMTITSTFGLVSLKGEDLKFGVLPYPMYEAKQKSGYQSLNWNGVLACASSIKNVAMVADVMEMLAWYTAPVKTSFYETLLGSKVANAPEDARMLDIIWGSVTSDIGLIFDSSSEFMDRLLYAIPQQVSLNNNREMASWLRSNSRKAENALLAMFVEK